MFGNNPLTPILTDAAVVPLPTDDCVDVPVYEPLAVPYRNSAVVVVPLGVTVPLSVAVLPNMLVAEPVDTVGGVKTAPSLTPKIYRPVVLVPKLL